MIGVDPASLIPLACTSSDVPDAPARFAAIAADWIEEHYGANYFVWAEHWRYVPNRLLARAFSREERIRLWHGSVLSSKLDDYFQEHEELTWKVQHSLWRYGCLHGDYPRFVECYNGLSRLSVDLPGFAVRITHTRSINTAAWAADGRDSPIYLDASFGALLYYQGKHVMTIGFALSRHGILVAQVQLREKRGNRFLYKLPMPYLDFALGLLQRAFPDDTLYIVTGASTTAAIRAAYSKTSSSLSSETAKRVSHFYDQSLRDYVRTGKTEQCSSDDGRVFSRLARCSASRARCGKAA